MTVIEIVSVILDVLGVVCYVFLNTLSHLFGLLAVACRIGFYTTAFLSGVFEQFFGGMVILGMLIVENCALVIPIFATFVFACGEFVQYAVIYIVNTALSFVIDVWTLPVFVGLRDVTTDAVCVFVKKVGQSIWENALLTGQVLLVSTWILLAINFRKSLFEIQRQYVNRLRYRLILARMRVRLIVLRVKMWIFTPIRAARFLCSRIWVLVLQPYYFIRKLPARVLGAIRNTARSAKTKISFPIVRRKSSTTDTPTIEQLKSDNLKLRLRLEEERDSKNCIICECNKRAIVCMPCRHFAICEECASQLTLNMFSRKVCPVCRTQIDATIKVYL